MHRHPDCKIMQCERVSPAVLHHANGAGLRQGRAMFSLPVSRSAAQDCASSCLLAGHAQDVADSGQTRWVWHLGLVIQRDDVVENRDPVSSHPGDGR